MMTQKEEEQAYLRGERGAWLTLLRTALRQLEVDDPAQG